MILSGKSIFDNKSIEITLEDNHVNSIQEAGSNDNNAYIAPAFVDLQVNGFAGYDFNVDTVTPPDICSMVRKLWHVGTGFLCPTIVTASNESISNSIRAIVQASEFDPLVAHSILGIHLEGPYISSADGPRGAHPLEHVREPDWDEFQRWQEVAEGMIRIVTLAPEKDGAIPMIKKLVASGVVVSLGHTNASSEDIDAAINVGAKLSTHLGNGAHAHIRRHPNYIWDQLAADELYASLIVDGHHLSSSVVKSMVRAKTPDKCILISDATALAGMPPGNYQFSGQPVELTADRCIRLIGTEYLAGSAIELALGVENSVRYTDLTLADAVKMATLHPARLLGVKKEIGDNQQPNLILFKWNETTHEIELIATILSGQVVFLNQ